MELAQSQCRSCVLLLVTLLLCESWPSWSQKLPTRDEDHFQFQKTHAEIIHDTKLLPDGAEVASYLYKDVEQRFFFKIEEEDTPFSLTVTPCASPLEWKISILDLPEERSGDGTETDQLLKQRALARSASRTAALMKNYSGDDVMSYRTASSPAGIYMIEIKATESDSSLKLYATTTPDSDHPYPELPKDSHIDVVSVSKSTVTVAWKPSPTSTQHGQPVKYCLSVNKKHNFKTHCAAYAYIHGDVPPTAPPNSGFGFSWEKDRAKALRGKSSPIRKAHPDDVFYKCIGQKTRFLFSKGSPGQVYYLNVFAVNSLTNRSTAYTGAKVKTKEHNKYIALKPGKVVRSFLKRSKGAKLFNFELGSSNRGFSISIQPCQGEMEIQVYKRKHLLAKEIVNSLKVINLKKARRGKYTIKVSSVRRRSVSFKILAITQNTHNPYPDLPKDTRIKVFDNLRKCESVTIAWLGTDKRLKYCLYKRTEKHTYRRLVYRQNVCIEPNSRKKSDKIMCRHFRYRNKKRSVITETVDGLKPDTTYVFDVYVTKHGGQTLAYQSEWVKTRSSC